MHVLFYQHPCVTQTAVGVGRGARLALPELHCGWQRGAASLGLSNASVQVAAHVAIAAGTSGSNDTASNAFKVASFARPLPLPTAPAALSRSCAALAASVAPSVTSAASSPPSAALAACQASKCASSPSHESRSHSLTEPHIAQLVSAAHSMMPNTLGFSGHGGSNATAACTWQYCSTCPYHLPLQGW